MTSGIRVDDTGLVVLPCLRYQTYDVKVYATVQRGTADQEVITDGSVVDSFGGEIAVGMALDSLLPPNVNPKIELFSSFQRRPEFFFQTETERERHYMRSRVLSINRVFQVQGNATARLTIGADFVYELNFFVRFACPKTELCVSALPTVDSSATEWALRFSIELNNAPLALQHPNAEACVFFHKDPACYACVRASAEGPMFIRLSQPKTGMGVSVSGSDAVRLGPALQTKLKHIGPVFTAPYMPACISGAQCLAQHGSVEAPSLPL